MRHSGLSTYPPPASAPLPTSPGHMKLQSVRLPLRSIAEGPPYFLQSTERGFQEKPTSPAEKGAPPLASVTDDKRLPLSTRFASCVAFRNRHQVRRAGQGEASAGQPARKVGGPGGRKRRTQAQLQKQWDSRDVERRRSADTGRKAERPQEEPPCPRQSWGFSPQDWERPHFCCSRRSGELTQSRCLNPNIRGEEEPRVSRGPGRRLSTCEPAPHAGRHPLRGEASPERALRSPAGACLATPKPQGEDGGGRAAPGRVLEKRERGGTRVLCPAAEKGRVWGREGACISPGAGEACEEVGRGTAETQALGVSSRKRRCLCVKTGASLHPTESKHG
ncbi:unnamed protein product [Rangifer tarandus platyrhynchus]|uniref:Uncharacterized protein n=1 Tax=Rangifer tarandus platyrhynchus TaxID=3082113 RepID=A0ABN8YHJ5_RANTA|nr:unnamed protein product [Rangifer tarandus platyrhynchus]